MAGRPSVTRFTHSSATGLSTCACSLSLPPSLPPSLSLFLSLSPSPSLPPSLSLALALSPAVGDEVHPQQRHRAQHLRARAREGMRARARAGACARLRACVRACVRAKELARSSSLFRARARSIAHNESERASTHCRGADRLVTTTERCVCVFGGVGGAGLEEREGGEKKLQGDGGKEGRGIRGGGGARAERWEGWERGVGRRVAKKVKRRCGCCCCRRRV